LHNFSTCWPHKEMNAPHDSVTENPAGITFGGGGGTATSEDIVKAPGSVPLVLAGRPFPWTSAGLWLILLTALFMRIPAITHDLPALYTHDEVSTVETALRFGGGSLRPYSYGHGPLMAYLMAGLYGVYYGGLKLVGTLPRADDFILGYLADPTPFYIIHRGFTVVLALGLIGTVYLVGSRLINARVGLIAAVLTAFANLLFVLSVAGREDMLYLFLVMLGVYSGIALYEGNDERWRWIATGAIFGLATTAKYFGVFGLLFPLCAVLKKEPSSGRRVLFLAGGYVGGVFVGMPFAFLDFQNFIGGIAKLVSQTSGVGSSVSPADGLAYLTIHLQNSVGLPLYILSVLAGVVLLVARRRIAVYLFFPSLVFLAFLVSRPANQGHYYVAFAVPFLCLAAAAGIDYFMAGISSGRGAGAVATVLVIVVLWPNLLADLRYLRFLSMPDTRGESKRWIEQHVSAGASVLIETHSTDFGIRQGPPLRETAEALRGELEVIRQQGGSGRFWEYKITEALQQSAGPRYGLIKTGTVTSHHVETTTSDFVVMSLVPDSNLETYRALAGRAKLLAQFRSSANFRGDLLVGMDELSTVPVDAQPNGRFMRGPTMSVWQSRSLHHNSSF